MVEDDFDLEDDDFMKLQESSQKSLGGKKQGKTEDDASFGMVKAGNGNKSWFILFCILCCVYPFMKA